MNNIRIILTCALCNREFTPKYPHQGKIRKYCSPSCAEKASADRNRALRIPRVKKNCLTCGSEFETYPKHIKTAKYCSKPCADMGSAKIRKIWNKGIRAGITLTCEICGKKYYVSPARKDKSKYCSKGCDAIARSRVTGVNHHLYTSVEVPCANCGEITVKKLASIRNYHLQFCSRRCVGAYCKSHQSGRSGIELIMRDQLRAASIEFIEQYGHKHGVADFFVAPNLIIECDGEYWHRLPEAIERDKRKDAALKSEGFNILRFWENEIHAHPTECVNEIRRHIE